MAIELTDAQKWEAFNAVVTAFDNCGFNAPYADLEVCIEGAILVARDEDDETVKAIYDEAIRVLQVDRTPEDETL